MIHLSWAYLPLILWDRSGSQNCYFSLLHQLLLKPNSDDDKITLRQLLFGGDTYSAEEISCTLTALLVELAWQANIAYLEFRLMELRNNAISRLDLVSFQRLALLRRNVTDLQNAILATQLLCRTCHTVRHYGPVHKLHRASLEDIIQQLMTKNDTLFKAVDHEMQLVIGSVTIQVRESTDGHNIHDPNHRQDSTIMKQQAQRATVLTILAAIYLPLTLVTGIFGMNIKEINDGEPRFWSCILVLLVIAGGTGAGFFGYQCCKRRSEAWKTQERMTEDWNYKIA